MGNKRLKIGIFLGYDSNWLGGVYYIKSIIESLDYLEDAQKPQIILFYNQTSEKHALQFKYSYLEFVPIANQPKYFGYLYSWFLRKNVYIDKLVKEYDLDGLFPINDLPLKSAAKKVEIVAWFPDLQHKFYPQYFSKLNLFFREWRIKLILKNADSLVVSSQDVLSHFNQFYSIRKDLKIHTLPFVSNITDSNAFNIDEIREKYKVQNHYFMVSNQFYEHKNHAIVFKAIHEIVKKEIAIQVVFTGKFEDYKNPNYINGLKELISTLGIEKNILILGIIPREEQIKLLKNCKAIIQPSLFEGWSTIVEDAKTLQVPIITSNIAVHIEQQEEKGIYFDPHNADDLANTIITFLEGENNSIPFFDNYNKRVIDFALKFTNIFLTE